MINEKITTIEEFTAQLDQIGINGTIKQYEDLLAETSDDLRMNERFIQDKGYVLSFIQIQKDRVKGRKIYWLDNDYDADEDARWLEEQGLS